MTPGNHPDNEALAIELERIAGLLEAQKANPHRVRAYRRAASRARQMDRSLAQLLSEAGLEGLEALPDIGESLARLIAEFMRTGKTNLRRRLEGEVEPAALFTQVPGIGPELARRIVKHLDVDSLPELEQAAYDGRLGEVPGFGKRRVALVRDNLAGMFTRTARHFEGVHAPEHARPPVSLLLEIDVEYRRQAESGELRRIAPRRFNPEKEAWLPILHTEQEGWEFTALYSNTARAHELGKTHDWVVLYYEQDSKEGQATVVTETSGPQAGLRVVRGREAECLAFRRDSSAPVAI